MSTEQNKDQLGTDTALVTGAFSGIGLATALRLAKDGWRVYAAGRNLSKSGELTAQSKVLGVQVKPIAMDVTDENSIQTAMQQIERESGRLDLLVNNAGAGLTAPVTNSSNEQMRQIFETNVIGVVAVTRSALPLMLRHQRGRVVNISSALGKVAFPGAGIYAATKFAMEGLSDAMRLEFKILGPDFHVILIEPGFIKTNFAEKSSDADHTRQTHSVYGDSFVRFAEAGVKAGIDSAPGPEIVANTIAQAARQRNPKSRYAVTSTAATLMFLHRWLPTKAFDSIMLNLSGLGKYLASQRMPTQLQKQD